MKWSTISHGIGVCNTDQNVNDESIFSLTPMSSFVTIYLF